MLITNKLRIPAGQHASQNIVKEGVTRKIFQNKDLAGKVVDPKTGSYRRTILRCKCARFHCAVLISRVKVGCHKECDFRCGKVLRRDLDRYQRPLDFRKVGDAGRAARKWLSPHPVPVPIFSHNYFLPSARLPNVPVDNSCESALSFASWVWPAMIDLFGTVSYA